MPSSATVRPGSRFAYQVTAVAVLAAIVAGCSSSRFSDSLFTGATNGAGGQATSSQPMPPALVGNNPVQNGAANLPTPQGQPTGQVAVAALPPATNTQTPLPANNTVATPAPAAAATGTAITVSAGDTLYSLSRSHGVSVAAIAAANGLTQTSQLTIGQRLTIPAPGSTAALGNGPAPLGVITETNGTPAPQTAAAPTNGIHVVQSGETMYSIATRYGLSPSALATANNMPSPQLVRVGQELRIPGTAATTTTAAVNPAPQPVAETPVAQPEPQPTPEPEAAAPVQEPAQVAALPTNDIVADPPATNGTAFRWPVNGNSRVISDFGPKPGGERNDGINISVPTGTEVHAAESGTVIYAGNGIAGYGNLVLIEHADNWVTAYAHASEILVQRDQSVQRGQVIARSGSSGSVSAPQLHFELRRGTVPVNPLDYLTN